jgi:CPA2 family monovalent cation:H+ antiporter-2
VHQNLDLLFTLGGGLGAALVLGFVTDRLRLSPIVGYLLAGIAVGPFTPGFVARPDLAQQLAELGVVLLMFGVGLQFHLKELLAVRKLAVPGALLQIAVATALGAAVAPIAGWSLQAGIVFGLALSVASTVVLLRVLADNDALHTRTGHVAVGWLVVEDIFTVVVLVLLPVLAGGGQAGSDPAAVAWSLAIALGKIAALVAFTLIVGQRAIPLVLAYVAKTRSRELFTLSVLVIALGIALGSAQIFGVSMALGAFLAGMVVGQSDFSSRAASEALPMRDAFAVLFFVSVGMLFDPMSLVERPWLTLAALAIVLVGKPIAALAAVLVLRHPISTAVPISIVLAQIGEFSFILANLGNELGILPAEATEALIATAILSITLNPLLYRLAPWIVRRVRRSRPVEPVTEADVSDAEHRAIVIGYGPVGRLLTRLLREHGIAPTVIELNHDTVAELKARGVSVVHGDAMQREILEQAGIRRARTLIFAASGTPAEAVVRAAKDLNPDVRVFARSQYATEVEEARAAGADVVVAAEAEVAIAMTEHVMSALGAAPEQLDRARDRIRAELGVAQPDDAS